MALILILNEAPPELGYSWELKNYAKKHKIPYFTDQLEMLKFMRRERGW